MIEQPTAIDQTPQSPAPNANQVPEINQSQQPETPANLNNRALRRSPFLAAFLSIAPGLGQIYIGYYQVGFVNVIVIASLLTLLATGQLGPLIPMASVFLAFFWLYNIVDAFRRAVLVNEALAGRGGIELPEEYSPPGLRGSVLGGAILIIVGLVLLSRTLFGVSLEWTEDWWPLAIVLFGGYLIFKARTDSPTKSPSQDEDD